MFNWNKLEKIRLIFLLPEKNGNHNINLIWVNKFNFLLEKDTTSTLDGSSVLNPPWDEIVKKITSLFSAHNKRAYVTKTRCAPPIEKSGNTNKYFI